MKGYTSKYDRAIRVAKSYGYREEDLGFKIIVKQYFARLLTGPNRTIVKENGKYRFKRNN
jgi:hypothetical protein